MFSNFNDAFMGLFGSLNQSFNNPDIPEDSLLTQWYGEYKTQLESNSSTSSIYDVFEEECIPYVDDVYSNDDSYLRNDSIGFLKLIGFSFIWGRMNPTERCAFSDELVKVTRMFYILKLIQSDFLPIREFVTSNSDLLVDPQNNLETIYQRMKQTPEVFTGIMDVLTNPDQLERVQEWLAMIFRQRSKSDNIDTGNNTVYDYIRTFSPGEVDTEMKNEMNEMVQCLMSGDSQGPDIVESLLKQLSVFRGADTSGRSEPNSDISLPSLLQSVMGSMNTGNHGGSMVSVIQDILGKGGDLGGGGFGDMLSSLISLPSSTTNETSEETQYSAFASRIADLNFVE